MSIFIALGSNLPFNDMASDQVIEAAIVRLTARGVKIVARSRLWQSPSWPDPTAPAYVNAVARVETQMHADTLLDTLQSVETEFGRVRSSRNAPRTLDLDILDFAGRVETTARLVLPHPRMAERAFVLLPLRDIAPTWVHPDSRISIDDLLAGIDAIDLSQTRPIEES